MIRKATEADAPSVHRIMVSIPWIKDTSKSADACKQICCRGEIYVLSVNSVIAAMMILRKDMIAASFGHNIWSLSLVATAESERRKGYARKLVQEAKRIGGDAVIQAHVQNDHSLALLISEDFIAVEGQADANGYPLYEWTELTFNRPP